jgi:DNA-3-methyladenine glycosylase
MNRPDRSFYLDADVVKVARALIGKVVVTDIEGTRTSALITCTEAYAGVNDRASHAFGGRRTARTEVMFATGGTAYVYLCYGIHHLFNVVTNAINIPHAVLIREGVPLEGRTAMEERLGRSVRHLGGPGVFSKALGIHLRHAGTDLLNGPITITDRGTRIAPSHIRSAPRIGVDYAGADALLPYRFNLRPDLLP